jgi:hypothetical protein
VVLAAQGWAVLEWEDWAVLAATDLVRVGLVAKALVTVDLAKEEIAKPGRVRKWDHRLSLIR